MISIIIHPRRRNISFEILHNTDPRSDGRIATLLHSQLSVLKSTIDWEAKLEF